MKLSERLPNYIQTVEEANDFLLYRRFDECADFCVRHSKEFGNHFENTGAVKACEALCIVAIQAYAEQDQSQEVLPYVIQLYDGLENSPRTVVQMCLLLHVEIGDHATCAAIATVWLRNPENFQKADYHIIAEIYVMSSLVPQARWHDIVPFLDACCGLETPRRDSIVRNVKSLRQHFEQSNIDQIEVMSQEGSVLDKKEEMKAQQTVTQWRVCKNWLRTLSSYNSLSPSAIRTVRNVLICAIALWLLLMRLRNGMLLKTGAHESLHNVLRILGFVSIPT